MGSRSRRRWVAVLHAALAILAARGAAARGVPDDRATADDESEVGSDDEFDFGAGDEFDFDNDGEAAATQTATVASPAPISIAGLARSDAALWVERLDDRPLAKARQSLDLSLRYRWGRMRLLLNSHAEYDLAYLYQREAYDDPTLESYEWLVDTREAQVSASLSSVDVTIGRQIVVWGESDLLAVMDIVNSRDEREIGVTELDDVRRAALATRVGYFHGPHRLEAMVVHEADFGLRSPPFGPFSALPSQLGSLAPLLAGSELRYRHRQDRFSVDNQQLFGRWLYRGTGVDLGLYAASVLERGGVFVVPPADALGTSEIDIELDHRRTLVFGHSGAWAKNAWVLKWELRAEIDRAFNVDASTDEQPAFPIEPATLFTPMIGGVYSGIRDTVVVVEVSKAVFVDEPDDLLFPFDAPIVAVRATHKALKQDLEISGAGYLVGLQREHGWLARMEVRYALSDVLKASLGFVTYQPGDELGPLSGLTAHDRLFANLRWDFLLL